MDGIFSLSEQGLRFYLTLSYAGMLALMVLSFFLVTRTAAKSGQTLGRRETVGLATLCVIYVIFSPLITPVTALLLFEK